MRVSGALFALLDSRWLSRAGNGLLAWAIAVWMAGAAVAVWNFAIFQMDVLTVIAVVVMVFGLLVQITVLVARRRRAGSMGKSLAEGCRVFARELGQFEAARRHGRPEFRAGTIAENLQAQAAGHLSMDAALGRADRWLRDPIGDRSRRAIAAYDRESLREYHDVFGVRAAELFDQAVADGVADARDEAIVSEPRSSEDLAEVVLRFRGYADVGDPAASTARREARLAVLIDRVDGLMAEGIDLRNSIASAPLAQTATEGNAHVSFAPDPERADEVSAFDERARSLLTDGRAALLQDYTEAVNACLRRHRDGERPDGPVDLKDALKRMRDGPLVLYMDAFLEGLAAVRRMLGRS